MAASLTTNSIYVNWGRTISEDAAKILLISESGEIIRTKVPTQVYYSPDELVENELYSLVLELKNLTLLNKKMPLELDGLTSFWDDDNLHVRINSDSPRIQDALQEQGENPIQIVTSSAEKLNSLINSLIDDIEASTQSESSLDDFLDNLPSQSPSALTVTPSSSYDDDSISSKFSTELTHPITTPSPKPERSQEEPRPSSTETISTSSQANHPPTQPTDFKQEDKSNPISNSSKSNKSLWLADCILLGGFLADWMANRLASSSNDRLATHTKRVMRATWALTFVAAVTALIAVYALQLLAIPLLLGLSAAALFAPTLTSVIFGVPISYASVACSGHREASLRLRVGSKFNNVLSAPTEDRPNSSETTARSPDLNYSPLSQLQSLIQPLPNSQEKPHITNSFNNGENFTYE